MACGMLSHMVLHLLAEQPASGYALCTRIERSCGQRPSYGSIYPLLERFTKEGLLTVKTKGRSKVYSLTRKGEEREHATAQQHASIIDEERVRIRRMMELMDTDPEPMLAMLERARTGKPPLGSITAKMFMFRDLVFRMAQDGRAEKHSKEINALLAETARKLEKMS